jgi:integrase
MNRVAAETERGPKERRVFLMTRRRSHQKGTVERHNGQWTLRYREFDHTSRKWTMKRQVLGEFKDKKTALKTSEPIMARVNERNNTNDYRKLYSGITFKEFIEKRWRAYTLTAKHQVSTVNTYNTFIDKHLIPFFGNKLIVEITPSDISDFLDSRRAIVANNTLQMLYGMLHLMFEIARQYDLIEHSPVRPLVHKPESVRKEKPTLTAEQIRAVLRRLSVDERLYLLLLAVTGMRMNEGLALRWVDFDEGNNRISVTHTLYRSQLKAPKTKGSKAILRLYPLITNMLSAYRQQSSFQTADDFIFARRDGQPLSDISVRRHLYKAMEATGIKREKFTHGFHIFRHSAGTLLYDKIRDLKQVQTVLRHSDISTTADL